MPTHSDDIKIEWIQTDLQAWDPFQTFQTERYLPRKAYYYYQYKIPFINIYQPFQQIVFWGYLHS